MRKDKKIQLINAMPPDVELLLGLSLHRVPVTSKMIDDAKAAGPQYFNQLGEFDPFFESRSWHHIATTWIKREVKWYWWRLKCKLGFRMFHKKKAWKCHWCGKPMREGLIPHLQNCKP